MASIIWLSRRIDQFDVLAQQLVDQGGQFDPLGLGQRSQAVLQRIVEIQRQPQAGALAEELAACRVGKINLGGQVVVVAGLGGHGISASARLVLVAFATGGGSCGDEPHASGIGAGDVIRVGHGQQCALLRAAEGEPALFIVAVRGIEHGDRQRVRKLPRLTDTA